MTGASNSRRVFVVGTGMSKFEKPGKPGEAKTADYIDFALEATTKALTDTGATYDAVEFAAVGYCYGDSTSGQRALYQLGLTQIPIVNVNNNCSTGSTALYLARQAVQGGSVECAMALGFEKMSPGSLASTYNDRTNPLSEHVASLAGMEYCDKNPDTTALHMELIGVKNHLHSTLNPYSQFRTPYTLEQVQKSRKVFGPLTMLQCCPTSDGAGCAILASEDFVRKHSLQNQAIEIVSQVMKTDSPLAFDVQGSSTSASSIELAGADMTRRAAEQVYKEAGIKPSDIDVVELHDCFSANELITYDALSLCPPGQANTILENLSVVHPAFDRTFAEYIHSNVAQVPPKPFKKCVVNPSGGLISKGHPLGGTGLAQCFELTSQLRQICGPRQVRLVNGLALQHNVGLGGAVVVTLYKRFPTSVNPARGLQDLHARFGYNPAVEARGVTPDMVRNVRAASGGIDKDDKVAAGRPAKL